MLLMHLEGCRHPQMTLDKQAVDKMSVTSQQQSPPPASTPPPDPPVEVVHEIIETGAARKRDEPPALPPRPPPRSRQPPGVDIVEECGGLPIQPCLPPRARRSRCWSRGHGGLSHRFHQVPVGAATQAWGTRVDVHAGTTYSSPMASLVLTDSSQLIADSFEKLPDQISFGSIDWIPPRGGAASLGAHKKGGGRRQATCRFVSRALIWNATPFQRDGHRSSSDESATSSCRQRDVTMQGYPVMQVVEYRVPASEDPAPNPPGGPRHCSPPLSGKSCREANFLSSIHKMKHIYIYLAPRLTALLHRSCWLRKYVFLCTACGGLSSLLGALFLTVYFMLRSYTSSLNYFETVPTYVPAAMLIVTGMIVMCLAGRRNRFAYLIKVCGGCCLACAVLCVVVTITTTVIHMNRLQTLRQCVYTQTTQTCTCSSGMVGPTPLDHGEEGLRYAFNSTPDCDVVHGVLYSCLRAMFGLSVIGILVCLFSCMLVYQLLSHEKKKMYWEQLEMRCRYLYRQQRAPHPCSCCDECRYPEPFPWELMEDRYWAPGRVGNFYSPNPGEEGSTRRAPSGWSWRRLPWSRGAPPATANTSNTAAIRELPVGGDQGFRNTASSPDSQYGFSSHPAPAEGSLDSNIAPYSARETRPSQTLRTAGGPFVTEGSAGYAQHYYMWGPPPPYSNPHSHCNSPARREPRGKVDTNAARLHHLHHHHHHHHCQQNNTTAELRHRQGRGRYDEFSSSSGEGVVNSTDADKGVQVENYVNTSETEMVASGNTTSETTDSSDSKDRLNNTLTTRKVKKRIDITTVKSPTNFPYSPEHQPRSQKSSPSHFIVGNNEVGNMQGINNKQSCQMGDRCHGGSHEMEILTEEAGQFPVSLPPNMNTARGNDGCSVTGNVSPRMRYVAHLQGQDLQGHMLCTKNEPTESEVYFADVSSCCNVSVRNDGQDSSLYDEAVDPRKQRLVMMNVPPSSGKCVSDV
uniref:Uncharacterized protein n=1 Tax=Timema douglasi TaxID=61478 RepID=A0A7R8Z8A3_TIMDO|nr:unnamed protein product [Timema douglasi]